MCSLQPFSLHRKGNPCKGGASAYNDSLKKSCLLPDTALRTVHNTAVQYPLEKAIHLSCRKDGHV